MYKYHYDHVNRQWCVFRTANGRTDFIRAFDDLELARQFCAQMNG